METISISPKKFKKINNGNRLTPYFKTPFNRRLSGSTIRSTKLTLPNENLVHLKELLNTSWKIYKLSPFFKFKTDPVFLRKYARLIAIHFETEVTKNIVHPEKLNFIDVSLCTISGLRVHSDEPEALKIIVEYGLNKSDAKRTTLVKAILCSVNNHPEEYLEDNFIHFPLLLIKGALAQIDLLFTFLKDQFDCCIFPLKFSSHELSWMLAMWAGIDTDYTSQSIKIVYSLPSENKDLKKITLTIDAQDCAKLWSSIHDKESTEFSHIEVKQFIKALDLHTKRHFRLNFSSLYLTVIGTPSVLIENSGRLKLFSIRSIHRILQHFTELVVEELHE